jgi:hypothetical protein
MICIRSKSLKKNEQGMMESLKAERLDAGVFSELSLQARLLFLRSHALRGNAASVIRMLSSAN